MVDVVLSTEDISILGGPETINLEVDFGAKGVRGSLIFINSGRPDSELAPDSQVLDLYINNDPEDTDEYQYVYQLEDVFGTLTWVKKFKLISNIYSRNYVSQTFTNGSWTKNIPVVDIVPSDFAGTVTASRFNIQFNVLNNNPVACSMTVEELESGNGTVSLPLTIKAYEFVDSEWVALSGSKTVHIFITMV